MNQKVLKKVVAIVAFALVCVMALAGCSKAKMIPASDIASTFYKLMVQGDTADAKTQLGLTDDDIKTILDTMKTASIATTKANLTSPGLYDATDADAEAMYQAQMEAFKKLTFTAEVTNEDKENATVVVKTNYYNVTEIDNQALESVTEGYTPDPAKTDSEHAEELTKSYIAKFQELMGSAEPSSEQKEFTVEFIKQNVDVGGKVKKMWMPKDAQGFGSDLISTVSGQ